MEQVDRHTDTDESKRLDNNRVKQGRSEYLAPNTWHMEIGNITIIFMCYVNLREYIKIIKWLGG